MTGLVIVTDDVVWSPIVTGCVLKVAGPHANDALRSPPVGGVSLTVHDRPAGMPPTTTGVAVVNVLNVPVKPAPQS